MLDDFDLIIAIWELNLVIYCVDKFAGFAVGVLSINS